MTGYTYNYNVSLSGTVMVYFACCKGDYNKLSSLNRVNKGYKLSITCYEDIEMVQQVIPSYDCIVGIVLRTDMILDKLSIIGKQQLIKNKDIEKTASCIRSTDKQKVRINDKEVSMDFIKYQILDTRCIQGVGVVKKVKR